MPLRTFMEVMRISKNNNFIRSRTRQQINLAQRGSAPPT